MRLGIVLAVGALWLAGCRCAPLVARDPLPGPWAPPAFGSCCPDALFVRPVEPHRGFYVGGAGTFLPNIGVAVEGGYVFDTNACRSWAVEAQGVWQFADDKSIVDDGNPEADDWYQVRAGLKLTSNPYARRHWVLRFGAVGFRATGIPNWVDDPGNYYGGYVEAGFETDLNEHVTVGPGISLMPVIQEDTGRFHLVPMVNYHLTWWLCPPTTAYPFGCGCSKNPPGEIYVDAVGAVSPNVGGGLAIGQVFARDRTATWSAELEAVFESMSDSIFGEGDGEFAQVRGGLKASFCPGSCLHPVFRTGVTWFRSTAGISLLDSDVGGDYPGAYLGAGLEWDVGNRFTTGPEISAAFVTREGDVSIEVLPRFSWHFILKL